MGRAVGPRHANVANAEAMMSLILRTALSVLRDAVFLSAVCIGVPIMLLGYLSVVLTGVGSPA